MKLKIRTHKDAFKAWLAPDKYEIDYKEDCVFCQLKHRKQNATCFTNCSVHLACLYRDELSTTEKKDIAQYVLRHCKNWRVENIRSIIKERMKVMGCEFI